MKTNFPISLTVATIVLLTFTQCKKDKCTERPKSNCVCTEQYDPVCGCNGKTYGNACMAECDRITSYTKGTCQ